MIFFFFFFFPWRSNERRTSTRRYAHFGSQTHKTRCSSQIENLKKQNPKFWQPKITKNITQKSQKKVVLKREKNIAIPSGLLFPGMYRHSWDLATASRTFCFCSFCSGPDGHKFCFLATSPWACPSWNFERNRGAYPCRVEAALHHMITWQRASLVHDDNSKWASVANPGGPWLPGAPLAPKISSKSCSFHAILREKTLFWANLGSAPPLLGVKTLLGPPWPKFWIRAWAFTKTTRNINNGLQHDSKIPLCWLKQRGLKTQKGSQSWEFPIQVVQSI